MKAETLTSILEGAWKLADKSGGSVYAKATIAGALVKKALTNEPADNIQKLLVQAGSER